MEDINSTWPHISFHYCLDRTFLNLTLAGPNFTYIRAATDTLLTVALLVTNVILISAIISYRRRFRGTARVFHSGTSMKFVLMLAMSDVLVGLTVPLYLIPHYFCDLNDYVRNRQHLCMAQYAAIVFSSVMSNVSLVAIAVDRYIAIHYTLKYHLIMTHRVCHWIIASFTAFALSSSSVLFFWNHWTPNGFCDMEDVMPHYYVLALGGCCHITILVVVAVVHCKMHKKAVKSASRRNIIDSGGYRHTSTTVKSARVVVLVAGVYFVCWTPYSICLMIRALHQRTPIMDFIFQLFFPLSYANSLINPFIYAWKNKEIQSALLWFIRRVIKMK